MEAPGASKWPIRFIPAFQRRSGNDPIDSTPRMAQPVSSPAPGYAPPVLPPSDGWKRWQIYFALLTLLTTCGAFIFDAGINKAQIESRLMNAEQEIQEIKVQYERKDVVEERLMNIEQSEERIEKAEQEQADNIQKLLFSINRVR